MAWARVFFPYGPGQRIASLVPSICRALLAGEAPPLRTPSATSDFLFLEDAAAALVFLLESRSDGVFNVGSGEPTSAAAVADTLLRAAGRPPLFAEFALHSEPGFFADTSAIRALGWSPAVALDEGLRRTWNWFREGARL
jgi:nucleoside-diphosphate-sugar epimerase